MVAGATMTALSNKVEFLGAMGDGYCHIADEKGNVVMYTFSAED